MSYPPEPPPHGPGYTPGYAAGYGRPMVTPTNGKATAALVTGIASLILSWCCFLGLGGIVAIALGVRARKEIAASGGTQQGDGLALAGIITGAIGVVLGLLVLVLIVVALLSGVQFDTGTTYGTEL